jgi:hypothetical protein
MACKKRIKVVVMGYSSILDYHGQFIDFFVGLIHVEQCNNEEQAMKKSSVFDHWTIDYYSATPKYLQLANAFVKAITEESLERMSCFLP